MRILLPASVLLVASLVVSVGASAQPGGEATTASTPTPETAASADTGTRLQTIEKQLSDLQEKNKALSSQLADVQEAQSQADSATPSDLGKTKIFGFFDMTFAKLYYSKKDSFYNVMLPSVMNSTFMLSGLNVYLGNQITERLKFLAELRFTYQPLGSQTSVATNAVLPNGQTINLVPTYTRTDTSVTDIVTFRSYQLGGVSMERVQVTYRLNDYLGVTAGRFLTPYGIWNVDHGSPVILMVRAPILQSLQIVPSQQLGLQLFGKANLAHSISLDYAATLSNGRGPMDTVQDLDENKAVGLRWRLNYESDNFSVSLGQYGYTGKYTDSSKTLYTGPGSADTSVHIDITNQYTEYDLANDLLIKFYGLRLQSEVVLQRVEYQVPPRLSSSNFNGNPAVASQYYAANYNARAFYGLLAYELPEALTTPKVRVTPFLYYERTNTNDAIFNLSRAVTYSGGLNIRPSAGLVFKLEYDLVKFDDATDLMPDGTSHAVSYGSINNFLCQLAVTF